MSLDKLEKLVVYGLGKAIESVIQVLIEAVIVIKVVIVIITFQNFVLFVEISETRAQSAWTYPKSAREQA